MAEFESLDDVLARFQKKVDQAPACPTCGKRTVGAEPGECDGCKAAKLPPPPPPDRDKILRQVGVPERLRADFDEARSQWGRLDTWAGDPWCAYLYGPAGVGKSMLAVERLWRWWNKDDRSVLFAKAAQVPDAYFGREGRWGVGQLEGASLLVLDELGRGHLGNAWEAVEELLCVRYDELRPTIITTNLPPADLARDREHIADRVRSGLVLKLGGDSQR